ncbi:reverse transcriptase domain-containing protein, partial [Tanacetum coccineum]
QDQRFTGWNGNDRQGQGNYNQRQHRGQSTQDFSQGHASGSAGQRRSTETLPPPPFDVILGMDWLTSHRATIDCYARTVIFGNVRQPEFVYHGSSPLKSVKLISAMKDYRTVYAGGGSCFRLLIVFSIVQMVLLPVFSTLMIVLSSFYLILGLHILLYLPLLLRNLI